MPKQLEENIGNVYKIQCKLRTFTQKSRPVIDKWEKNQIASIQQRNNPAKRKPIGWERIFVSYTSDGEYPEYVGEKTPTQ